MSKPSRSPHKKNPVPKQEPGTNGSEQEEIRQIKLPVVFGIRPVSYIIPLLVALCCLVLFAVFILPGISNPGRTMHFQTEPSGAAILVDGVYKGSTPCSFFVPAGRRTIGIERVGFKSFSEEIDVSNTLLGTFWGWFPDTHPVTLHLEDPAASTLVNDAFAEFTRFSYSTATQENDASDPVLSRTASALADVFASAEASVDSASAHRSEQSLLDASSAAVDDEQALRDWMVSASLSRNPLGFPTSAELASIVAAEVDAVMKADSFEQKNSTLPDAVLQKLRVVADATRSRDKPASPGPRVSDAGQAFQGVVIDGRTVYFSSREVSERDFAEFLHARPEWSVTNRDKLIGSGLVDRNYLENFDQGHPREQRPVSNVSWYAAKAYTEWRTGQLSKDLSAKGYRVALPSSRDWIASHALFSAQGLLGSPYFREQAVASGVQGPQNSKSGSTVEGMDGNLWEWSRDFQSPLFGVTLTGYSLVQPRAAAQMRILGGSWVSRRADFNVESPVGYPPDWSNAYTGFRIVLEQLKD